jgi:hypothetical protein
VVRKPAKKMLGYHFVAETLRDGMPIPQTGTWLEHVGPLEMCLSGLHWSGHPSDALQYAPHDTRWLCKIEAAGETEQAADKAASRRRKILARVEAVPLLMAHARWCALQVIHLWDAPPIVREYLTTGNESIRASARDAAWEAAKASAGASAKASAGASAGASAKASAGASARDAAWEAAKASAGASAGASARASAGASAWAAARAAYAAAAAGAAAGAAGEAAKAAAGAAGEAAKAARSARSAAWAAGDAAGAAAGAAQRKHLAAMVAKAFPKGGKRA